MTSIQERLQLKREPLDKWSIREQLCLASAVARSGDQNWMSVSRALKPFGEPNRPNDWFHQKNCAAQYGALLGNVETPKRKKRNSGVESGVETPAECILKKLLAERQTELKKLLAEEKAEFQRLQEDMKLLQSGKVTEEQLDKWCKEIDEEELKSQREAIAHVQWLKERDLRKQEIERAWRPMKSPYPVAGQKRKLSDNLDDFGDGGDNEDNSQYQQGQSSQQHYTQQQQHIIQIHSQETAKPALSPLLTSLLKSPSQVPNVSSVSTSILHNAITSQSNQKIPTCSTANPTIASLLSTSSGVTVSPSLQQLVSTAIGQDSVGDDQSQPLDANILDDDANLKIDDLANSILVQDGPLPEIKKEEVDDIISEIIENAQDIVADPDQHLQLDGNGDININLELDDLDEDVISPEEPPKTENNEEEKLTEKSVPIPVVDPFEFQEDPVLFQSPSKPSSLKQDNNQYVPLYQQQSPVKEDPNKKSVEKPDTPSTSEEEFSEKLDDDPKPAPCSKSLSGSVEIVEVHAEERTTENQLNKSQIQNIVHSTKQKQEGEESPEDSTEEVLKEEKMVYVKEEEENKSEDFKTEISEGKNEDVCDKSLPELKVEEKEDSDTGSNINLEQNMESTLSSDIVEDLYENVTMEVKIDKTGKAKRDYSRNKKKEEKTFDMLLSMDKTESSEGSETSSGEKGETEKKDHKVRLKSENERSSSPWTEEEDNTMKGIKRRYSTPGTPIDSLPNSPASSTFYDDDKDYRNWKKSVMLVYNRLASNKYASLFLKPITDDQAPGYSSYVYRPMDLLTIKKNIDNGGIRSSLEFKRDVMLMYTNAIMYNKTNDTVYNMALQMQQESMNPIEILLQAQNQVDTPLRRETRTSESTCKRKKVTEDMKNKKKKED